MTMLITNIIEYNFISLYGFIKTGFLYIFPSSKHYLKTEISNGKNTTSLRNDIVAMRKERKTKCCLMSRINIFVIALSVDARILYCSFL